MIGTAVSVCPCCPLAGVIDVIVAVPALTVKLLVTISVPEVIVTVVAPTVAVGAIVIVAAKCVASVTTMFDAVTSALLKEMVVAAVKCVNCPTIGTAVRVWPCFPLAGVIEGMAGVPGPTVQLLLTI